MKPIVIRFATAAALAAGMAFAQAPVHPPQQPPAKTQVNRRAMLRRRMMRALNLTDTQKQQAKSIFQEARQNAQPLQQQLRQNRQALAAAIKADNTAQIHNLTATQANVRAQVMEIRSDAAAKFYAMLTPDQRAKADQLHQRIRQRMMQQRAGQNGE
jgi:periplasmic protein CpxP/Spy